MKSNPDARRMQRCRVASVDIPGKFRNRWISAVWACTDLAVEIIINGAGLLRPEHDNRDGVGQHIDIAIRIARVTRKNCRSSFGRHAKPYRNRHFVHVQDAGSERLYEIAHLRNPDRGHVGAQAGVKIACVG